MGNFLARIAKSFSKMKDAKILMVGLDAAGKTTTLYKLKMGENVTTIPTIGFNVEGIETSNNVRLTVWDVGGQDKIRPLWRHYFMGTDAVIFVVDSQDRTRIHEAKEELDKVMNSDDMLNCKALLVFANKQDLPNAMTIAEISDKLDIRSYSRRSNLHRTALGAELQWYIQGSVATSGEGLDEGIDWISRALA